MKKSIAMFLAFAMLASSMIAFTNVVSADTGIPIEWVPGSGFYNTTFGQDYIIDTPGVLWEDSTILVRGNLTVMTGGFITFRNCILMVEGDVNITNGAGLTLEGTELKIHNTVDGEHEIRVRTGGTMIVADIDGNPVDHHFYPDSSHITANNTAFEYNLEVETGASFSMTNSRMSECGWGSPNYGLMIYADNTMIQNTYFTNCVAGVYVEGNNTGIINNFFDSNGYGVYVYMANNTNIQGNNFSFQSDETIQLDLAENTTIQSNEFWANNGWAEVYGDNAHNTQILGNLMFGEGDPSYAVNADYDYNILIDGNIMDDYSTEAVAITFTIGTISNNVMTGSQWGIEPGDSTLTISNNVIIGYPGASDGIDVYTNADLTIFDNTISEFDNGIYCNDNDVDTNFTAYDNYIFDCDNGIMITGSEKPHQIYDNDISNCIDGIDMDDSANVTIEYNTLNFNTNGIVLDATTNNTVIHNNSIASSGTNAIDNAPINWYNDWDYNYYGNYVGIDNDTSGDFIGDTDLPYMINGAAGGNDTHPRTKITTSMNSTWTYAMVSTAVDNVTGTDIYLPAPTPGAGSRTLPQIGLYYDNVEIDEFTNLEFYGAGMDWTVVSGDNSDSTFTIFDSDRVYFDGMTIIEGSTAGIEIDPQTSMDLGLYDVLLEDNGYGIYADDVIYFDLDIVSSVIEENSNDGIYGNYAEGTDRLISPSGEIGDQSDLAIDSMGNTHLVWADGDDEIFYMMLDPNGNTLIDTTSIRDVGSRAARPCLAIDSQDHVYILWKDDDSGNQEVWFAHLDPSLDNQNGTAATIGAIQVIANMQLTHLGASVQELHFDIDSNNDLHVFGFEGGNNGVEYDFFYGKYDNLGTPIVAADYLDIAYSVWYSHPNIKVDTNNNLHLVWNDQISEYALFYGMMDNNGNWLIYPTVITSIGEKARRQSMDLDLNNNVHIVWHDHRVDTGSDEAEIFYMKLNPYLDDMDGDSAFAHIIKIVNDKMLTEDDGDKSNQPAIAIGPTGNVHVVWREDNNDDLWYMKLDNNGNELERWQFGFGTVTYEASYWTTHWWLEVDNTDTPRMAWCDNSDGGYRIAYYSPSQLTGTVNYNIVDTTIYDNGNNGIYLDYTNLNMDAININIVNSELDDNGNRGIYLNANNGGIATLDITGSTINENSNGGVYISDMECMDLDIFLFDSEFNHNDDNALYINGIEYLDLMMSVDQCEFSHNNGNGIFSEDHEYGSMIYSITNCDFYWNDGHGIGIGQHYYGTVDDVVDVTISNNIVSYNNDDGIYCDGSDEDENDATYRFYNNIITANNNDGVYIDNWNENSDSTRREDVIIEFIGNDISYNYDDGINIEDVEMCSYYLTVNDNHLNYNGYAGIYLGGTDGEVDLRLNMDNNEIIGNSYHGLKFYETSGQGSVFYCTVTNTNFIDNGQTGEGGDTHPNILFKEADDGPMYIYFDNVTVTGPSPAGIKFSYAFNNNIYAEFHNSVIAGTNYALMLQGTEHKKFTLNVAGSMYVKLYDCVLGPSSEGDIWIGDDGNEGGKQGIHVWTINTPVESVFLHTVMMGSDYEFTEEDLHSYQQQWYYDVQVLTGPDLNLSAPNVVLTIEDDDGFVGAYETDINGMVNDIIGTELFRNYNLLQYFNTEITATNGMNTVDVDVLIDTNQQLVTILLAGDNDGDGTADNMDPDDDDDGFPDSVDDFPYDPTEWRDSDGDGVGDSGDTDMDGDGVDDVNDTFPTDPTEWTDADADGVGDNADPDDDNDNYTDEVEIIADSDPFNATDMPSDIDDDGLADVVDDDIDGDGVANEDDAFPTDPDEWNDLDEDGIGDNADTDDDGDGVTDTNDDFPTNPSEWSDTDSDGVGDNQDWDIDGDWVSNINDDFPYDSTRSEDIGIDTDGDGIGDYQDWDIDGDIADNARDAFPYNPAEWLDTDGDGIGNNEDTDDDNDGILDAEDAAPLFFNEPPTVIPEYPEFEYPEDQPDIPLYLLIIILIVTMILVYMGIRKLNEDWEEDDEDNSSNDTPAPKAEEPKVEEPPKTDEPKADLTEE